MQYPELFFLFSDLVNHQVREEIYNVNFIMQSSSCLAKHFHPRSVNEYGGDSRKSLTLVTSPGDWQP